MTNPPFDFAAVHRHFSAHCFNRAWDLMEKADRTPEENRLMVSLSQASLYHWQQRPDCTEMNLSIGYWQASRIQVLLGRAAEARRLADVCFQYSRELSPFYLGFAYEALARAEGLDGNMSRRDEYRERAAALANQVQDPRDREQLLADLATL